MEQIQISDRIKRMAASNDCFAPPDTTTCAGEKSSPFSCFSFLAIASRKSITPRSRMLLLCSPSNPSGSVYSRQELEGLVAVLARHPEITVLSDPGVR